jgi:hypothetical protein
MQKTTFFLMLTFFALSVFTTSCSKLKLGDRHGKHHNEETKYITIDKTLAFNETYTLDLNLYEDADDLSAITTQAVDFTISELTGSAALQNNVYAYMLAGRVDNVASAVTPKTEQVVLTITEGSRADGHSGGRCGGNNSHEPEVEAVITINFTIQ